MNDVVKGEAGEAVSFGGAVLAQPVVDAATYAAALAKIAELTKELEDRDERESSLSHASSPERHRIYIEEKRHSAEIDPVYVGCNGRGYYIKRGYEVDVPAEVVEVLDHAVQGVVRPIAKGGVDFIVSLRFPFRKLGVAIDKTGKRLLPELEVQNLETKNT